MNYKILLLDSYDGFRQAAMEACMELQYEPTILPAYDANLDLVSRIKLLYLNGDYPDVIITRGAIATYLTPFFPNSIFSLASPDDVDFLSAIRKACAYGNRIGLIIRDEYEYSKKAAYYSAILQNVEIVPYRYEKAEDVTDVLIQAKHDRMDVTVGGGTLALTASAKIGIPNIFVPTSSLSIKKALRNSLIYAKFKDEERRKNLLANISMNNIEYGLLIVEQDTILFANAAMREVVGIHFDKLVGSSFQQKFEENSQKLLDMKQENVINIGQKLFLVRKELAQDFGDFYVFTFQSANALHEKEHVLRSSLRDKGYKASYTFADIIAESPCMLAAITKAKVYAATDASVLIEGASGTGKELLAQSIHNASSRKENPFVAVNCAAIPENLFESELFGYEEGAFTGAKKGGKAGLFETAHNGTLFLDEINSLPYAHQGKLLRALEDGEFRKVGSDKIIRCNVRIICASNENLQNLVSEQLFRRDLYYRISTLPISILPLKERAEDVIPIAQHYLNKYCLKYNTDIFSFTQQEKDVLTSFDYSGNVRELENAIHRFAIELGSFARKGLLEECLHCAMPKLEAGSIGSQYQEKISLKLGSLEEMETELIRATLLSSDQNQSRAAEQLGISRSTLIRKMKELK